MLFFQLFFFRCLSISCFKLNIPGNNFKQCNWQKPLPPPQETTHKDSNFLQTGDWTYGIISIVLKSLHDFEIPIRIISIPGRRRGQSDDPQLRDVYWAQCLQGLQLLGQRRSAAGVCKNAARCYKNHANFECWDIIYGYDVTTTNIVCIIAIIDIIYIYIYTHVWLGSLLSYGMATSSHSKKCRCRHTVDSRAWMYPDKLVKSNLATWHYTLIRNDNLWTTNILNHLDFYSSVFSIKVFLSPRWTSPAPFWSSVAGPSPAVPPCCAWRCHPRSRASWREPLTAASRWLPSTSRSLWASLGQELSFLFFVFFLMVFISNDSKGADVTYDIYIGDVKRWANDGWRWWITKGWKHGPTSSQAVHRGWMKVG